MISAESFFAESFFVLAKLALESNAESSIKFSLDSTALL